MKKLKNGLVIIGEHQKHAPTTCADCGEKFDQDDLRPYGKGGAWICYDCGMKDEETVNENITKVLRS